MKCFVCGIISLFGKIFSYFSRLPRQIGFDQMLELFSCVTPFFPTSANAQRILNEVCRAVLVTQVPLLLWPPFTCSP